MKSLLLPERNGFRILDWFGSIVIGLALLIVIAWLFFLIMRLAPGDGMMLNPFMLSLLWLYALPLFTAGVLLRWAAALYRTLEENNRLLQELLNRKDGEQ